MKQNIIMIIILVALFVFGLLIYDFSDELSTDLSGHNWYIYNGEELDEMSFKKNKFSYINIETNKSVDDYKPCTSFTYNKSINVIKLNCSISTNKIYIASYDDEKLKLTIDGSEKTLYATKNLAAIAKFKKDNNLTDNEYNKLLNIDTGSYTYNSVDQIIALYKAKDTIKYLALINSNISYKNVLNYKALNNLLNKSNKVFVLLTTDDLSSYEAERLNKISDLFSIKPKDYITNEIKIYKVGDKKVEFVNTIDVKTLKEANNYSDNF